MAKKIKNVDLDIQQRKEFRNKAIKSFLKNPLTWILGVPTLAGLAVSSAFGLPFLIAPLAVVLVVEGFVGVNYIDKKISDEYVKLGDMELEENDPSFDFDYEDTLREEQLKSKEQEVVSEQVMVEKLNKVKEDVEQYVEEELEQ